MACVHDTGIQSDAFSYNDTAPTEIYTLSLHDALPICLGLPHVLLVLDQEDGLPGLGRLLGPLPLGAGGQHRSEEHTSELQSRRDLVCRLLLEKKNIIMNRILLSYCPVL